jgi:hypothetical protein
MAENLEWGMTPSQSMAQIHADRLANMAPAMSLPQLGDCFSALCREQRRASGRPRPAQDQRNPGNEQSLLPGLTPVELAKLKCVLPSPPLPYGYARGSFDLSGVLEEFNSCDPVRIVKAAKQLHRKLLARHLHDTDRCEALISEMAAFIEQMRKHLVRNVSTGHPDLNQHVVNNALAAFEKKYGPLLVVFSRLRKRIRDYDAARAQCELFRDQVEKGSPYPCLLPLFAESHGEVKRMLSYFGDTFFDEYEACGMADRIVRVRLLAGVLSRCPLASRRLYIHKTCDVRGRFIASVRNRLLAPGDGRSNPNWTDRAYTPLHHHTSGYAESMIFSWKGDNVLYVHGFVPFHMDKKMDTREAEAATETEERRRFEGDFEEHVLLPGDALISVQALLAMPPDQLLSLATRLGVA